MRKSFFLRIALFAVALTMESTALAATLNVENATINIDRWVKANFGQGKKPPFSFYYGGKPSATFITGWKHTLKRAVASDGTLHYTAKYADVSTGLSVTCLITAFPDFDAVEWYLRLENGSSTRTPQITKVNACDKRQ